MGRVVATERKPNTPHEFHFWTEIGAPVSAAVIPRVMPSVGFIATARTRFSPRCCSTSATTSIFSTPGPPSDTTRTAL